MRLSGSYLQLTLVQSFDIINNTEHEMEVKLKLEEGSLQVEDFLEAPFRLPSETKKTL